MLSILIPARNEKYLERTIQGIKEKATGEIEVLTEEDKGLGQRALTNKLARKAKGEYLMKVDAHCLFSKGFDEDLLKDFNENMIMSPYMFALDELTWQPKEPRTSFYCFDTDLVMQYDEKRENKELINETMCLQGSAWLVTRETYWKWNLGDESLGSWGGQGVELGIKAWLNGGVCVTNKNCYHAHLFRQTSLDFPYQRDMKAIKNTCKEIKKRFKNKSIAGLIEKFNYPADWTPEEVDKL